MSNRKIGVSIAMVGLALALPAAAQDIINPGDALTPSSANSPPGEPGPNAIDNVGGTKYLNFDELNTGFTVSPSGAGVPTVLTLMTANDAPERDPTSYQLEGSSDGVNFAVVASGPLSPPTARFTLFSAAFVNSAAYSQYRVTFPTVRNSATANSMQIAEVQLNVRGDITSAADAVSVIYTAGASSPTNQGGANLVDEQTGRKFAVTGGNLGPTIVNIIPAAGATVVTALSVFSSDNDQNFPGRTPADIALLGSNDGVAFTPLFNSALTAANANHQDEQFRFANSVSYARYRLVLGASIDGTMQLGEVQLFGEVGTTPPGNDDCASATVITGTAINGSSINATGTDLTACGTGDTADVWYSWTAPAGGQVEVSTCSTTGPLDTTLAVFIGCGGTVVGCNDNVCREKSRVRWTAAAGVNYLIRVAGVNGAIGGFTLIVDPSPGAPRDVVIPLAYNFNGMVHAGEAGNPDGPTGYRSISDRGIRITGMPGSLEIGPEGGTGLAYSIAAEAQAPDIVHLGDRNVTDAGNHIFDLVPDADDVGTQPNWLINTDQRSLPQSTDVSSLSLTMGGQTSIGVIYNASNGGNSCDMILGFTDSSSVAVRLAAPDWFGNQVVQGGGAGVIFQEQFGLFHGAALVDSGVPDVDLNIVETVISVPELIFDGLGDITGRTLQTIAFGNPDNSASAIAVYAATVRNPQTRCIADFNNSGAVTVQDIFDFLLAYLTGNPTADVNGVGGVTVQDIFDFLVRYFMGCP